MIFLRAAVDKISTDIVRYVIDSWASCCQRRTAPRPQTTCWANCVKFVLRDRLNLHKFYIVINLYTSKLKSIEKIEASPKCKQHRQHTESELRILESLAPSHREPTVEVYATSRVQGQSTCQGVRAWSPAQAKIILHSGFDYLTLWCFQIFRPLLFTCCIHMPLMQNTYNGQ